MALLSNSEPSYVYPSKTTQNIEPGNSYNGWQAVDKLTIPARGCVAEDLFVKLTNGTWQEKSPLQVCHSLVEVLCKGSFGTLGSWRCEDADRYAG